MTAAAHEGAVEGVVVVFQAMLRGLSHTLSNRVAALIALGEAFEPGRPADAELVAALRQESGRLEELLRLQRLLGGSAHGGAHGGAEPVHLPDLLPDVVALHAQRSASRELPLDVTGDPAALPVRVRPSALVQALLALVTAGAESARGAPGARLTLRYGGDTVMTTVAVEARWTGEHEAPDARMASATPTIPVTALARAAEWLLSDAGATLTEAQLVGETGVRFELALPTLLEVRRRERAGGRA